MFQTLLIIKFYNCSTAESIINYGMCAVLCYLLARVYKITGCAIV